MKYIIRLLPIVLLLIFTAGCGSSEENSKVKDTGLNQKEKIDTAVHTAPDQIYLKAKVTDYSFDGSDYLIFLRVTNVISYGSSAPSLPVGKDITASVSNKYLKKENLVPVQTFAKSNVIELLLQKEEMPFNDEKNYTWRTVRILDYIKTKETMEEEELNAEPGAVWVLGEIHETRLFKGTYHINVEAEEVGPYGPATPVVSQGTTLKLLASVEMFSAYTESPDMILKIGERRKFLLRYIETPAGSEDELEWKVITIKW